jgi:hypothetical protein
VRVLRHPVAIAVGACGLLAIVGGCTKRPLPEQEDGAGGIGAGGAAGIAGQGGGAGTSCSAAASPRLELIGTPLLVLDRPVGPTELYTSFLWTGDEYLLFWRVFHGDGVFMQRIDASGQAVGGNTRVHDAEDAFDVAWGGGRLAATWTRPGTGANVDLIFQTFDGLGRPMIDAVTLRSGPGVAGYASATYGPRIVPIGGGFAIAWNEDDVLLATVDLDGHLQNGPVGAGGSDIFQPRPLGLAATSDRILVGWTGRRFSDPRSPLDGTVTMTRAFSSGLTPLGDSNMLDIVEGVSAAQLLATGSGFLALWNHGFPIHIENGPLTVGEVRIAQLDGAGASVATHVMGGPVSGASAYLASASWNGDHLIVLWDNSFTGSGNLTLSRFAPDGTLQGEFLKLPTMSPATRLTVTAHGVAGFIWSEEIAGADEIYFQQARSCP